MKKVLLGGVALITLGFVGAAAAADMPVKAPAPVVVNTWTGYYVGGDAGGINGSHESDTFTQNQGIGAGNGVFFDPTAMNSSDHWGAMAGVYAGYNWAVTPSWVIGVEGDWNKANLGNTTSNTALTRNGIFQPPGCVPTIVGAAPATCAGVMMADNLSWIATVRGRLGYTWGSMMLYGTGGVAWMNQELSGAVIPCTTLTGAAPAPGPCGAGGNATNLQRNVASIATSSNSSNSGWVAGGGVEFMATAHWLLRLEYLHYQFSSGTTRSQECTLCVAGFGFNGAGTFTWGSAKYDAIRAGLAYKF